MKARWVWIAAAAAAVVLAGVVLAGGGLYYARMRAQGPPQGGDMALGLLLGIRRMERHPATQLTEQQITTILPFLKALKDMPASNTEQVGAVVRAISHAFTPAQKAALEEMRQRIQAGRRAGGPGAGDLGAGPGFPGGPPGGPPGAEPQQARARLFEATIRMFEQRIR